MNEKVYHKIEKICNIITIINLIILILIFFLNPELLLNFKF